MACDSEGGIDRLLQRRAGEIRRAGVAAAHLRPFAEIDGDADAAVAVMLDGVGLAFAHRHRQAIRLGDVAIAAVCAGVPGALQHHLREAAQFTGVAAETVALRHGGAMITARAGRNRQQDPQEARDARAAGARRGAGRAPRDTIEISGAHRLRCRASGRRPSGIAQLDKEFAQAAAGGQPHAGLPRAVPLYPAVQRSQMKEELIVGLVSISDRASAGVYRDEGIPSLKEWLHSAIASPAWRDETRLIADEMTIIES